MVSFLSSISSVNVLLKRETRNVTKRDAFRYGLRFTLNLLSLELLDVIVQHPARQVGRFALRDLHDHVAVERPRVLAVVLAWAGEVVRVTVVIAEDHPAL